VNKDPEAMWNRLKEPSPIIDKYGITRWYNKAGKLHRENDLPAVMHEDGSREWYINGKRHRENDMPAIIREDGSKEWFVNGEFIKSACQLINIHNLLIPLFGLYNVQIVAFVFCKAVFV